MKGEFFGDAKILTDKEAEDHIMRQVVSDFVKEVNYQDSKRAWNGDSRLNWNEKLKIFKKINKRYHNKPTDVHDLFLRKDGRIEADDRGDWDWIV